MLGLADVAYYIIRIQCQRCSIHSAAYDVAASYLESKFPI